jgi:hypothetical protein
MGPHLTNFRYRSLKINACFHFLKLAPLSYICLFRQVTFLIRHKVTRSATKLPDPSHCYPIRHNVTRSVTVLPDPSQCYPIRHNVTRSVTKLPDPSQSYPIRHSVTRSVTKLLELAAIGISRWHRNKLSKLN